DKNIFNYEDFLFIIEYLKAIGEQNVKYIGESIYNYTEGSNAKSRTSFLSEVSREQLSFFISFKKINAKLNPENIKYFNHTKLKICLKYLIKSSHKKEIDDLRINIIRMLRGSYLKCILSPCMWDRYMALGFIYVVSPRVMSAITLSILSALQRIKEAKN
uniref:hypothetical protein n=1 Tax=Rosenbergiella australiborealis TaxID=1544696 RepID=UPI001F4E0B42